MSSRRTSFAVRSSQKGAALAVIMIMLLVMMLLGLAILRSTMLEERMSAGMYDRGIAFELAERALREGEQSVDAAVKNGNPIGRDCSVPTTACPTTPADTYIGGGSACADASGVGCWANASVADSKVPAAGTPQYYVEFMGRRTSADDMGDVNGNPYEPGSVPQATAAFYRVTARSHDPSKVSDRAVVVLQSTLMSY
ncbi:pilX N-terminal family protein [Lysobacter capsici]|uniref:pilus assembly PilX family protein n=1 Tax=Lysobacter capsici TaxID=435897 RepID=UPI00056B948D|nr:PilX N-terminal domain-containing pilus assembly protein [Lysobacter capsici]ALN84872.1 pilX N-terminal family protein [Lysobacter capsici]